MLASTVLITPRASAANASPSVRVTSAASSASGRGSLGSAAAAILTRNRAITGIFLILSFIVLYCGRSLFIPVTIAVLGSFLLGPVVRLLMKLRIPRSLAALVILLVLGGGLGMGAYALSGPASSWMQRLPGGLDQAKIKLHTVFGHVAKVNAAAAHVASLAAPEDVSHPTVTMVPPSTVGASVLSATGEVLAGSAIMVITLFFLLASGSAILDRAARLIPALRKERDSSEIISGNVGSDHDTVMVLRESERLVCLYLSTTVCINVLLAGVLSLGFWCAGLPNPLLWGVFAGLINFLPYVGPLIGIPVVALASIISFDAISAACIPPLIYAGCAFIEGNLVTPAIVGNRLAMSPLAVFLWMALWGWMWGAAGALIAVPMLVMVRAFCSRVEQLRPIATLIEP